MKKESIDVELTKSLFTQREFEKLHLSYTKEFSFYYAVQKGDLPRLKTLLVPLTDSAHGFLSKNIIRNMQYHFCIGVAMITRFCVDGGMDHELAYTLSDLYIQRADNSITVEQINHLHMQMVYEYTNRMRKLHQETISSKSIILCLDYIHSHLHDSININTLASIASLNPSYLSTLFKKQTGLSVHSYIIDKKVEAAKNLLQYSTYSSVDIANYLSFSSHSHFIFVFKKHIGITPCAFRNKKFRSHWK